jgi:hypothetical protein
MESELAMHLLA